MAPMRNNDVFAVTLVSAFAAACGSGASVEGDVDGWSFDLSTIFAWIDATEAEEDGETGKVIFKARPRKDLHVVLSGASYDPEQDVRFTSTEDLLEIGRQE